MACRFAPIYGVSKYNALNIICHRGGVGAVCSDIVLHYYHTIVIIYSLIVKHACLCTEHSNLLSLNNISAAEANIECELALRDNPLLANNIPVGQVTAH